MLPPHWWLRRNDLFAFAPLRKKGIKSKSRVSGLFGSLFAIYGTQKPNQMKIAALSSS